MIACVYIPDFAVVVAREYHGISPDWPLLVARYTKHQGKVVAASPEARQKGVKSGMTIQRGLALCPSAQVVNLVESPQRRAGDGLLEILSPFSDRLELEVDHAATLWVDLGTIADREARSRARQLRDILVDHTLFLPAIGLATGKFPSRIAAVVAGDGKSKFVPAGYEKAFLTPFPAARLALTKKQLEQFKRLGIETLGQLAALPASAVQAQFGKIGKQLHGLANGIDLRPVAKYSPRLKEYRTHNFEPAVEDRQVIEAVLRTIVDDLATYVAVKGLTTQDIVLSLRTDTRQVLEERIIPREPIAGYISLYTHLWRLLEKISIPSAVVQNELWGLRSH